MSPSAEEQAAAAEQLRQELYALVREDSRIFDFLEAGAVDGMWYWDVTNPEFEWLSPRFKALFGYEDHEIANTPQWWQENIHPDDLQLVLDNFEAHCADPSHPYDQVVRYRHRDGSTVWVRCRGIAIRDDDGRPIRLLGVHTDVTQLKHAKLALERTNAALADFAGSVAHDLKNPIGTISGFARLLCERVDDLPPEARRMAERILRLSRRSAAMIDDLLDFAQHAGPTGERSRVDLTSVFVEVVRELSDEIAAVHGAIEVEPLPLVRGNRAALTQVATNLLSNAIKCRSPERPLRVRVSSHDLAEGREEIHVTDNGVGVPPAMRRTIFQLGVRGESGRGSGIGLATCRAVIGHHGGTIRAEDGPDGVGTAIVFSLARATERRVLSRPRMLRPSARHLRVIIVEDDRDAASLTRHRMRFLRHPVVGEATTAEEARELVEAEDQRRDLVVLLDYRLAHGDTLDLAVALLALDPAPIVVLHTAHLDDALAARAAALGVEHCVSKLDPDALVDLFDALGPSRRRR